MIMMMIIIIIALAVVLAVVLCSDLCTVTLTESATPRPGPEPRPGLYADPEPSSAHRTLTAVHSDVIVSPQSTRTGPVNGIMLEQLIDTLCVWFCSSGPV